MCPCNQYLPRRMDVIVIDDDDSSDEPDETPTEKISPNFGSLPYKNQIQQIENLRAHLRINNCPLVYNPKSSFEFNLALKINSIDFETFEKSDQTLENLLALGNSVVQVYNKCDSTRWLTCIIKKLSKTSVQSSNDAEKFFHKLWDMKKELFFPSSIAKMVVFEYPSVLEDSVIDLVTACCETDQLALQNHLDDAFNDDGVKTWVTLCAKCPQMFQISCSIIQTLLHYSRGDRSVLAFAQCFHRTVRGRCNLFHRLFPEHLQFLVRKLETRTLDDEEVLNNLLDLLVADRPACQALLTCFPMWLPRVLVFAVSNHVASIISEEFGDWHN